MSFHPVYRGDRIELQEDNTVARRTESYNGGIVYSAEPLDIGDLFQIRLDAMEKGWAGSLVRHARSSLHSQDYQKMLLRNAPVGLCRCLGIEKVVVACANAL